MSAKNIVKRFDESVGEMVGRWPSGWYGFLAKLCVIVSPIGWVLVAIAGTLVAVQLENEYLAVLSVAILVVMPLADLIKVIIRRKRPISMYVDTMRLKSYSFPSTHAYTVGLGSIYLIAFAMQYLVGGWLYLVCFGSVMMAIVVSLARVYLKAHFPSDVLVGCLLGVAVAIMLAIGLA